MYLLERIKGLFKFRDDILEFLNRVHEREVKIFLHIFLTFIDNFNGNEEDSDEYLK